MKRILLYSPDVIGHPRVYCRVIADALATTPCEVFVVIGLNDEIGLEDCPDLQPLAARANVRIEETRSFSSNGSSNLAAEGLVAMQRSVRADVTLFIEADKSNDEFRRIAAGAAPRLLGRNLGIFANTGEWYPGEDSFTGEPRAFIAPKLRTTLGNVKRAIFERARSAKYFYENTIIGARVLDELFVKDERLSEWYGPPVHWMPEISRPVDDEESDGDREEYERRKCEVDSFKRANGGREVTLYFGDAAFYKGYDLFLRFVELNPGVCAIHAGRTYSEVEQQKFQFDVAGLRERLRSEGRLLETNAYLHRQKLKELYFSSVRVYLTTHRLTLSSSTVIQALELGKPVLVPNRGLLGYRVRTNGLGDVYEYGNLADLSRKAGELWNRDLDHYSTTTRSFWARFSDDEVRRFFVTRLLAA